MITTGYKDIFISEDDFLYMIINDREQRQRTPIMHTDIAKQKRVATHANKWTIIWKKYYSNSFDKIIYVENCCSGIRAVFMISKIELTPFNDWRKILLLEVVVLHFCSKMNRFFRNCAIHLKKQQNIVMVCSNVDRIFFYMHMPWTTIK